MKAWFGAAGRLVADAILLLLLAAAAQALVSGTRPAQLVPAVLAAAKALFPLAIAAAIFFGFYSFERRIRSRALTLLSLFLLGLGLAAGGLALRQAFPPARQDPSAADRPNYSGLAIESERRILFAQAYEAGPTGFAARSAVGYDVSAPFPRLVYDPRVPLAGGALELGGRRFSVLPPKDSSFPELPEIFALSLAPASFESRLLGREDGGYLFALAAGAGLVLMAAGFASVSRFARWPLAGRGRSSLGLVLARLLDGAVATPAKIELLAPAAEAVGLAAIPMPLVASALEAILGLLAGLAALAAPHREEA
ncbi:MAG: hypothetical protein JNG85_00885 [Spirochaetaceae bacterium]|nr:hypothetical protein [Spirochaetaceae bacterium]